MYTFETHSSKSSNSGLTASAYAIRLSFSPLANRMIFASFSNSSIMMGSNIFNHSNSIMKEYDVRPISPFLKTSNFSGGNQQKIILSRELNKDPKVLLVGQPTRGVDIGAIEFIHQRIIDMRNKGAAILLVSVELDEILSLSDRIVIMFDGSLVGEKINENVTDREVGLLMAGITN